MKHINQQGAGVLLASLLVSILPVLAADDASAAKTSSVSADHSEIEQLKQILADQQRQIDELRQLLAQRRKDDNGNVSASAEASPASAFPNLGKFASRPALVPAAKTAEAVPLAS